MPSLTSGVTSRRYSGPGSGFERPNGPGVEVRGAPLGGEPLREPGALAAACLRYQVACQRGPQQLLEGPTRLQLVSQRYVQPREVLVPQHEAVGLVVDDQADIERVDQGVQASTGLGACVQRCTQAPTVAHPQPQQHGAEQCPGGHRHPPGGLHGDLRGRQGRRARDHASGSQRDQRPRGVTAPAAGQRDARRQHPPDQHPGAEEGLIDEHSRQGPPTAFVGLELVARQQMARGPMLHHRRQLRDQLGWDSDPHARRDRRRQRPLRHREAANDRVDQLRRGRIQRAAAARHVSDGRAPARHSPGAHNRTQWIRSRRRRSAPGSRSPS